jgi:hypothetical protein
MKWLKSYETLLLEKLMCWRLCKKKGLTVGELISEMRSFLQKGCPQREDIGINVKT